LTALKTKPELYIDNLERLIRRTAEQTGQNPTTVMQDVLKNPHKQSAIENSEVTNDN
jgi:hypothetical protein